MNLKLCTMAATIWGLQSITAHRSMKPRTLKSGSSVGQSVAKQIDSLDSLKILATYNRVMVESNLK